MKKHYTIGQLAKKLGVCKNTIFYWLNTDKIKGPKREQISGFRYWTEKEVRNIQKLRGK
ncbi:MAG: MerR family transcriptional regulator [Patescibacteria group bacterium]